MSTARPAAARHTVHAALALGAAAVTLGVVGPAQATTYSNVANGAPTNSGCNLSDALKAATTNTAVHGCAAGSGSGTDTINLRAGIIYQNWGTALHVPSSGGAVVIQGAVDANGNRSIIRSRNLGYPSGAGGTSACSFPAAIFSGGTLTVANLNLQGIDMTTSGLCQYGGTLTVDNVEIGDGVGSFWFAGGAIRSNSNSNAARTLVIRNASRIVRNQTPHGGAALSLTGNVTTSITNTRISQNQAFESGGAILWAGGWGKMGNLTLTSSTIDNNQCALEGGWGGALYLDPDDTAATVTINGTTIQVNAVARPEFSAGYSAGAIFIGGGFGLNKLVLTGRSSIINGNLVYSWASDGFPSNVQQWSLNSDPWVFNAISCRGSSMVEHVVGSEWNGNSPQLKGDGTCILQP